MENCKQKVLNIIREKNPETMYRSKRDELAEQFANNRANRKGGLSVANVMDILPQHLKDEVYEDADDAIGILTATVFPAHLLVALADKQNFEVVPFVVGTDDKIDCIYWHVITEDEVLEINITQPLEPQLDDEELCEKIYTLLSE